MVTWEGSVARTMADSEPWWPPVRTPRPGAPNIVVILADDLGYSDIGCFGAEIPTPNIDRLASGGLRYTDFHATPMCSPSRAALMTGLNGHQAGFGLASNADPGFPGYAMTLPDDAPTIAELLRDAGYATGMVGKWHLCRESEYPEGGDRGSWPVQRGFTQFYGFLESMTNQFHPHRLYTDNTPVHCDSFSDDYFLTDDLTDRAVTFIHEHKAANPARPFFLYFAHASVHAPLQAKAADLARHRGAYDIGWDECRARRFARQVELGIVDPSTRVAPRGAEPGLEVPAWSDLDADRRALFARHMEVYAAMVDEVDQSVGRVIAAIDAVGELENTVVVFTSDNGASSEGMDTGTTGYLGTRLLRAQPDVASDRARLDDLGGPRTWSLYPRGWAMVSNTPFRLYKRYTHAGGHQVPFVLSWPAGIPEQGLRRQYQHISDLAPSLLEIAGVERPAEWNGRPVRPLAGRSFAASLTDPAAPAREEQVYELMGNRGFYRRGWEVVTYHRPSQPFSEREWELYHLTTDPTELDDRAAVEPERLRELADAWETSAWRDQIFPIDDGSILLVLRPEADLRYATPVTIRAGTPTLERWRSLQLISQRSFSIRVSLDHDEDDEGVLVAHGDQGGGYCLYVEDSNLYFVQNQYGTMYTLPAGRLDGTVREIGVTVSATAQSWDVTIDVDADERANDSGFVAFGELAPWEGIDVGIDRRSPVSWDLFSRRGPFQYSGRLESVTYMPGPLVAGSPRMSLDEYRRRATRYD